MPPIETYGRTQTAVYWAKTGRDAYNNSVFAVPVEIQVRWEASKRQGMDRNGRPVSYSSEVVLGQAIPIGSLLYQGTLDDWYGVGSAGDETGLMEVDRLETVPDEKGRNIRRTALLMRYKGKPS